MGRRKVCESNDLLPKATESPPKKRTASVESRYQSELKKLQRLTKDAIPDEKRSAVLPLMSNIAFLKVKLDEARRELMYESIFKTIAVFSLKGNFRIFDQKCMY